MLFTKPRFLLRQAARDTTLHRAAFFCAHFFAKAGPYTFADMADQRDGRSGRNLVIGMVLTAIVAGLIALRYRDISPPIDAPTTESSTMP